MGENSSNLVTLVDHQSAGFCMSGAANTAGDWESSVITLIGHNSTIKVRKIPTRENFKLKPPLMMHHLGPILRSSVSAGKFTDKFYSFIMDKRSLKTCKKNFLTIINIILVFNGPKMPHVNKKYSS
jgi:hypothetical protein